MKLEWEKQSGRRYRCWESNPTRQVNCQVTASVSKSGVSLPAVNDLQSLKRTITSALLSLPNVTLNISVAHAHSKYLGEMTSGENSCRLAHGQEDLHMLAGRENSLKSWEQEHHGIIQSEPKCHYPGTFYLGESVILCWSELSSVSWRGQWPVQFK